MTVLDRIKANPMAYDDFKAWLEYECPNEPEDEEHAMEYAELLDMFNPLNIRF